MNEANRFHVVVTFAGVKGGRSSSYMTFAEANRLAITKVTEKGGNAMVCYTDADEHCQVIVEYHEGSSEGSVTIVCVGGLVVEPLGNLTERLIEMR
jgi:hypothetical protein